MYRLSPLANTILFTILHFVVDGICATIVFSSLYTETYHQSFLVFMLYNSFAFLLQPLVGLLIDRLHKPKLFLVCSVLFLSLGWVCKESTIFAAICLGIGNSFFHICGGKEVTLHTKNDLASLGIFVSTGAVGLMLGTNYYSDPLLFSLFTILFVGAILYSLSKEEKLEETLPVNRDYKKIPRIFYLVGIVLIVMIRAFVGKIVILDFEVTDLAIILIAISTCLGKMLGGVSIKYFGGVRQVIAISMLVAIPCLVLWNKSLYAVCIGIFMFNFSMPVTLYYANCFCPKQEGFAFGLLAAFLFPGYLLGMLEFTAYETYLCIAILSVISLLGILVIARGEKKYEII